MAIAAAEGHDEEEQGGEDEERRGFPAQQQQEEVVVVLLPRTLPRNALVPDAEMGDGGVRGREERGLRNRRSFFGGGGGLAVLRPALPFQ